MKTTFFLSTTFLLEILLRSSISRVVPESNFVKLMHLIGHFFHFLVIFQTVRKRKYLRNNGFYYFRICYFVLIQLKIIVKIVVHQILIWRFLSCLTFFSFFGIMWITILYIFFLEIKVQTR